MATDLTTIEGFKGAKPAQAFVTALGAQKDNLADGIGSSYGVIGYKGKVWSLRLRGESHIFVRPDDGTPSSYIDVIVLRAAHNKSKSYYEKYDPNDSSGKRPICSSLDGIIPDADVPQQQSSSCAICPRNAWKVNAEGRKGRECTDYKRLAVLIVPSQTKALLGSPLLEPVFLRIPPASLNDLAVLGETMDAQGFHYSSYVTRISFDPEQPHPKMVFKPLQALTDGEAPVVLPMRDSPTALRITGEDQTTRQLPAPQQQVPQVQQAPVQESRIIEAVKEPEKIDVGFGDLAKDNGAKIAAGGNTAAALNAKDVGEATESDAALDDRIANLLAT